MNTAGKINKRDISVFSLREHKVSFQADLISALSVYLQVRNRYPVSMLLESTDYHGKENSKSYLCFDELFSLSLDQQECCLNYRGTKVKTISVEQNAEQAIREMTTFISLKDEQNGKIQPRYFGYTAFDAVSYFDKIPTFSSEDPEIPVLYYSLFRFVFEIDHFSNRAICFEYIPEGESSRAKEVLAMVLQTVKSQFDFSIYGEEEVLTTEEEFLEQINHAKENCSAGDVFQLVLSRRFVQKFEGDDFQLYRALRSVNPSPYLFFYDHGDFRLIGSSPEAQLIIRQGKAEIHPIAGTFRRSGDDKHDQLLATELLKDEKENAEHIMLVDLARNDLSKYCRNVAVEKFREIQFYSHVIHMVSKVTGELKDEDAIGLMNYTFPAGTLSGAPKFRALQLIHSYENHARGFYGGAIGMTDFVGNNNQAIMIRTVMSKDSQLYYQAGAGIVFDSDAQTELKEVEHKLGAIRKAIQYAVSINKVL